VIKTEPDGFLVGLLFDPEDGGDMFRQRRLTFN
jgi:hypothetical protein